MKLDGILLTFCSIHNSTFFAKELLETGVGEIEKVEHLKSRYQKSFEKYPYLEISYWFGQNFSVQGEKSSRLTN
jgi:hypothetical protein